MTNDKMLAHRSPAAPGRRHRQPARGRRVHEHRTTVGHGGIHRPGGGPVARGQPFTRAGPDTAHHHHRGGGHPRIADLCAALRAHRGGQRRALRRGIEFDVRVRLRVRRGHRHQPRPIRQPGGPDGPGIRRLPRLGSAPAHADDHRPTQLPAGVRRPGRQRLADAREQTRQEATKDRDRPPGTAIALRDKDIELHEYYRRSSKARGAWRASRATAGYSSAARRAGDRAGRQARLGNNPELPGARAALGR